MVAHEKYVLSCAAIVALPTYRSEEGQAEYHSKWLSWYKVGELYRCLRFDSWFRQFVTLLAIKRFKQLRFEMILTKVLHAQHIIVIRVSKFHYGRKIHKSRYTEGLCYIDCIINGLWR